MHMHQKSQLVYLLQLQILDLALSWCNNVCEGYIYI